MNKKAGCQEMRNEMDRYNVEKDMNSWRTEPCLSPADTYIEWCFEQKCKQLKNGFDIITEWRMRKRQYVSYLETTAFDFQHFSRHDDTHSINILESIEMLLGKERINLLSAGDLWLLLECSYMHDMGMTLNNKELVELWEKDEEFHTFIKDALSDVVDDTSYAAAYYQQIDNIISGKKREEGIDKPQNLEDIFPASWPIELSQCISLLITDYIRPKHAMRVWEARKKLDKNSDPVIPERLYKAMLTACDLHGRNFEDIISELNPCCKGFGNSKIHPRFAAAMLRIGDMLDVDNNRFNPRSIEHYGKLPYVSMLHYRKHQAISHIAIRESGIEVEAVSEDIDVCKVLSNWFQWIENETKDLICYWNDIVPEDLRGCLLKVSKCDVYYKSGDGQKELFHSKLQREFEVNKKKLIDVLIGTNIYTNSMDFIREYLQNAMDASKMQLWIDLKNQMYRFSENINHEVTLDEMSPFDIGYSVYDRYEIRIEVKVDMFRQKVKLSFTDVGIGMEEECIKVLSKVGTGWRGRSKYSDEIKEMPKWLRPTGGFGIGIQSAFMVTDQVTIITRDQGSIQGQKITLTSPKNRGVVIEEGIRNCARGTTIEVELNLSEFYDNNRKYKQILDSYSPEKVAARSKSWSEQLIVPFKNGDFFNQREVQNYIVNFLQKYIETMMPGMLFPIRVVYSENQLPMYCLIRNNYFPKRNYWENGEKLLSQVEKITLHNDSYLCIFERKDTYDQSLKAIIWDEKYNISYYMSLDNKNDEMKVCFKNVLVKEEVTPDILWIGRLNLVVDYMGFKAEDIIKIHRDKFNEKFINLYEEKYVKSAYQVFFMGIKRLKYDENDVNSIINGTVYSYLNRLDTILLRLVCLNESLDEIADDVIEETISCNLLNIGYGTYTVKPHVLKTGDFLKKIEKFVTEKKESCPTLLIKSKRLNSMKKITSITSNQLQIWYSIRTEEGKSLKKVELLNEIMSSEQGENISSDLDENKKQQLVQSYYEEYVKKQQMINPSFKILDIVKENNMIVITDKYADMLLGLSNVKCSLFKFCNEGDTYAYLYRKEQVPYEEEHSIYINSYVQAGEVDKGRYVANNVKKDFYPSLQVDCLPYEEDIDRNGRMIISPIGYDAYADINKTSLVRERSKNVKIPYDMFLECIINKADYEAIVKYVYERRCYYDEQIEMYHIREEYEKYIRGIYEAVKPLL